MAGWRCPVCFVLVSWPPPEVCPRCAAPLRSDDACALVELDRQLNELGAQREKHLQRLTAASPRGDRTAAAASRRSRLSGVSAQVLLAACGAGLLGLAAVAFPAVNWTSFGPLAQAALLFLATVTSGAASQWTRRRGLLATAEALAGLAAALGVVVVAALRRSGIAGLDQAQLESYLAVSGIGLAGGILLWARWAGTRVGQIAAVVVAVLTAFVIPEAALSVFDAPSRRGPPTAAGDAYPLLLALTAMALGVCGRLLTDRWALLAARVGVGVAVVVVWVGAMSVGLSQGPVWALGAAGVISVWLWTRRSLPTLSATAAALITTSVVVATADQSAAPAVNAALDARLSPLVLGLAALLSAGATSALPARRRPAVVGTAPVVGVVLIGLFTRVSTDLGEALGEILAQPWTDPILSVSLSPVEALGAGLAAAAAVLLARGWASAGPHTPPAAIAVGALQAGAAAATAAGLLWALGAGIAGQIMLAAVAGACAFYAARASDRGQVHPAHVGVLLALGWGGVWSLADRWVTVAALIVAAIAGAALTRSWAPVGS